MSIAQKAVRGVAWNMATGVGSRIVGLIGTLVLTRFIAPGEYGEVAAASICVLTASMFTSLNLGQYIIAAKATRDEVFHTTAFHIALGVIGIGLVMLLRGRLGAHLDAPGMARFVPGLALTALLERISYVPERTLVRDLEFKRVAVSRSLGELSFTFVSLACAPFYGGMAIVFGNLARSSLTTTLLLRAADRADWFQPVRLRWHTVTKILRYCVPLSIATAAEFAAARWDNLLVSRFYGPSTMGMYTLAYNLADTPTGNVAEHIGDVLLPSFARMEQKHRADALLRSSALMALIVFPLAVGLGVVSPTVVHTFFNRKWIDVAPMLTVLSVLSVVRPLGWTLVAYTQSMQRPRLMMALGLFKLALLVVLISTLGRLGPRWVCVAVGLVFALHTFAYLFSVRQLDGLSMTRFLLGAAPPLLACVVMGAAVVGVRLVLRRVGIQDGWLALILETLTGMIVYVAAALVVARKVSSDMLALLRKAFRRG
jgi:PST family polysaccharide transporter